MYRNIAGVVEFLAVDTATGLPKTGDAANITAYVSIDGGAVTALGDTSASELSSTNAKGVYRFDHTAAEANGKHLLFSAKSSTSGVEVEPLEVWTRTPPLAIGTAQAGAAGSITLAAGESSVTDFFKQCIAKIVAGTGIGQARLITAYNGTTKVATVNRNWATTPDNTSIYEVWESESADPVNVDATISSRSTYAGADTAGTTTLLSRIGSALTITLGAVNVNDKTGFSLSTAGIKGIWDQPTSALTTAGSMGKYLIDSITTLLADTSTIINRIGAFTGSGVNTVLGFFKGLLSKTASTPSDVGGTFDASTDSTEAIRDRGDAAWGASGSAPQVLVDTTVAVVTDQTHFELTAAVGGNNTYLNQTAVFYDASGSNAPSVRKITAFADASNAITIDSAPDFTVVAGDGIKIFVTPPGTSAPTAAEVATAVHAGDPTGYTSASSLAGQINRIHALAGGTKTTKDHAAATPATVHRNVADSAALVTRTRTVAGDTETVTPS